MMPAFRQKIRLVVRLFCSCSNVRSRKNRKDKGLDEGYDQFDEVHKGRKQYTDHRSSGCSTYTGAIISENKDQSDQTKNNNVPCRDVGKKTNHQGEWLDEKPQDLYRRKNDLYPGGNTRHPEYMLPVMFISVDVGNDET